MWLKWEEVDVNTYSKRPEVASRLKLVYVKLKQNAPRRKNKSDASADLKNGPETGSKDGAMGATAPWSILMRGGRRGEDSEERICLLLFPSLLNQ